MPSRKHLAYSRKLHDRRIYGKYVYKPHFLDIIATTCTKDINEAKKRVQIESGKYKYTPSREYVQFLKKHSRVKK